MVQPSSGFLALLFTLDWGPLCWADEEVIDSAGVVLAVVAVALEGVLPGGSGSQGLQAYFIAPLLVLTVHTAVGLHSGSVFGVEGGIPVSTNEHGLF